MQSTSEPRAITGLPEPQRAVHAVGMPAPPSCTVKPFCRRIPVRNFVVSNSWKPSSPKLKTESFHFWMFSCIASTSRPTFCLFCCACGDVAPVAIGPVLAGSGAGWPRCAPSETVISATVARAIPRVIGSTPDARLNASRSSCHSPGLLLRRRLRRFVGRRVLDAELFEIVLVLGRIVVVLPHLRPVLLHPFLVQPDRRLIFRTDERHVLRVLRLDIAEVIPRLRDEFGTRHQIEHGERDDLGAVLDALVRDRRRHRDRVRPVVPRTG